MARRLSTVGSVRLPPFVLPIFATYSVLAPRNSDLQSCHQVPSSSRSLVRKLDLATRPV